MIIILWKGVFKQAIEGTEGKSEIAAILNKYKNTFLLIAQIESLWIIETL